MIHGRADAFLYDRHSILRHHLAHPDTTRALLEPLSRRALRHGGRSSATRSSSTGSTRFLHDIRADGRYAAMYEKHFGVPPDDRGREVLVRVAVTAVVFGLLVGALALSPESFDFDAVWAPPRPVRRRDSA